MFEQENNSLSEKAEVEPKPIITEREKISSELRSMLYVGFLRMEIDFDCSGVLYDAFYYMLERAYRPKMVEMYKEEEDRWLVVADLVRDFNEYLKSNKKNKFTLTERIEIEGMESFEL